MQYLKIGNSLLEVILIFVTVLLITSFLIIKTKPLPINLLVRALSWFQPFCQPVFNPDELPSSFPPFEIVKSDSPYPGTLLFTNATNPFQKNVEKYNSYIIEIDKISGKVVVYYRILTKGYLFQPQPEGYSYGILEKIGVNGAGHNGTHYIATKDLKISNKFKISNLPRGTTDMHEFLRLKNGNVLMLSYRTRKADLSVKGGFANALVYDPVIVEQTSNKKIVWLWDGKDHLNIFTTTASPDVHFDVKPPLRLDYAHPNGLAICPDANLLLSMKHMDCIVKINRETGDIIWTLGGSNCKNNQFVFLDDPRNGFSHQHHVRSLPNGNLLIFDNGTLHPKPESRAIEYEIDEQSKTARLVWSYKNGQYTPAQGSVERLSNGNTLIGWGFATHPFVSEVTPEGKVVLAINLPEGQIVYRVYQGNND